jgi:hypothetical protein
LLTSAKLLEELNTSPRNLAEVQKTSEKFQGLWRTSAPGLTLLRPLKQNPVPPENHLTAEVVLVWFPLPWTPMCYLHSYSDSVVLPCMLGDGTIFVSFSRPFLRPPPIPLHTPSLSPCPTPLHSSCARLRQVHFRMSAARRFRSCLHSPSLLTSAVVFPGVFW